MVHMNLSIITFWMIQCTESTKNLIIIHVVKVLLQSLGLGVKLDCGLIHVITTMCTLSS